MTNEEEAKAQGIVESWFWQMSEGHNFRWKNAVKSMTLFYESAPMESDVAQLVVEYLRTRSGVTSLVIGHKPWTKAAPGWMAKDAWYQTVPSEKWAGTESTKVRVYWVLVEAGDGAADGPYVVEDGCKYKVTHWYYWDVAAEPELPQSSSGVQYTIQGFTRDRETGLFTYIVEKRETVEQSIPLYESAKTIFETVSEAQHLGVKQGDVAATGLAASVGDGVRVERHLSKNPDCTTDIVNRKVEDKKVEESRKVAKKSLRGTETATTDRNLSAAEAAAKTAAAQDFGETRSVEKTDTNLRNLTVETFTPGDLPITLAESCERQASVHTDTKVEAVERAAVADGVEQTVVENDEEVPPEPNTETAVSYRMNDDGKTADKTTTTRTWKEKTGGGSTDSGNGVVTSTTERKENTTTTPTMADGFAPGVNKVVEIEETPNDHGSKTTIRRVTAHTLQTAGGSVQSGPDAAAAQGNEPAIVTPVKTTVTRKQNAAGEETAANGDTGVNKTVEVENQPNGMGGFNTVKRVTVHGLQEAAGGGSSGTASTTATERRQNATVQATAGAAADNVVVEVDNQPNGMGGFNTVKRTTAYSPKKKTERWSDGKFHYRRTVFSNQTSIPAAEALAGTGTEPLSYSTKDISFHINAHGTLDGVVTERADTGGQATVQTLQWTTNTTVASKYYYFNRSGRLCYRQFTATLKCCYGRTSAVVADVADGDNVACVGWNTTWSGNCDYAMGRKYTNVAVGAEVEVDGGSSSSSSSSNGGGNGE